MINLLHKWHISAYLFSCWIEVPLGNAVDSGLIHASRHLLHMILNPGTSVRCVKIKNWEIRPFISERWDGRFLENVCNVISPDRMSECSRYETECVMCDCQPDVRGYPGDIWGMFAISDCHLRVPWLSISRSAQLSHIVSHTTKDRTKADSACFAPSCHVIILHISQPGRETPAVFAAARRDEKKALSLSTNTRPD